MKKIPIKAAKEVSQKYNQDQVILVTFDKTDGLTHVVTYGKTLKDCEEAAIGGNLIKKLIGFPENLCKTKPRRIINKDKSDEKINT